ncbi:hypothetical protein F5890DRAFT_522660 [Lentinula detonsa]|uniref:Uncharacterized protein n=1 Tax=Lentinula detonsa TaxID=2804962 RepID=A0AA38Q6C5_9AGAR|nr:hypothetical protein F5890DRAFT_522660 [Lentinula detonsa]
MCCAGLYIPWRSNPGPATGWSLPSSSTSTHTNGSGSPLKKKSNRIKRKKCRTTILGVGLGGLLAVAGIVQLKNLGDVPMKEKWPYIVQIVVYALYAMVSVQAFFGATCRKLSLIRSYAIILAIHLIFSIASGGYSLYHYFQDSPNVVADCINGSTDDAMIETCKQGEDVVKGVMVGVFIFVWIMELCKFDVGNSDLSYLSFFLQGVSSS